MFVATTDPSVKYSFKGKIHSGMHYVAHAECTARGLKIEKTISCVISKKKASLSLARIQLSDQINRGHLATRFSHKNNLACFLRTRGEEECEGFSCWARQFEAIEASYGYELIRKREVESRRRIQGTSFTFGPPKAMEAKEELDDYFGE